MKSGLFQYEIVAGGGGGGVTSVFGRAGVVVAVGGDYTASQVTNVPAGNIAAVTIQDAVNELDTEKAGLALANIFTAAQAINLNAASLPAPPASNALHIGGANASNVRFTLDAFGGIANISGRRANGTAAAPTAVLTSESILVFGAFGYGSTAYSAQARSTINFVTSETWTDAAQGMRITFATTTNGTAAVPTARWSVENDGSLIYAAGSLVGNGNINALDYFDNGVNINTIYAGLASANLFSAVQTIDLNAAALPAPIAGTILHLGNSDGSLARILVDGFVNGPVVTGRRANTSAATPSAVNNGDALITLNGVGYGTTGYSANARGALAAVATENWTDAAQGTRMQVVTTTNGSILNTVKWSFENDGSLIYNGGALTGVSTVNALGYYTAGNVVIDADRSHSLRAYTVGTLPAASGASPMRTFCVTDALAPVVGAAVVGGGAVRVPVYDNGAWTCDAGASTGISGIRVEDEGTSIVATATALNFAGAGVTVTDAGGGEALVTIPGGGGSGTSIGLSYGLHLGSFW